MRAYAEDTKKFRNRRAAAEGDSQTPGLHGRKDRRCPFEGAVATNRPHWNRYLY